MTRDCSLVPCLDFRTVSDYPEGGKKVNKQGSKEKGWYILANWCSVTGHNNPHIHHGYACKIPDVPLPRQSLHALIVGHASTDLLLGASVFVHTYTVL